MSAAVSTYARPLARHSFFAFMGLVLLAVCAALFLNMPPERSAAATYDPDANVDGDYTASPPADAPVVDAHVVRDAGN
ncbi:hypothetical protein [Asticcacaulis solisilvae]|uniref:hypothetical protein n=1 Tax=Asticcacaulis solisilvae TaxID=1217274 RepID=UPI003FD8EDA6